MKTNVPLWLSRHQTFSFWEIHFFSCLTDNVQTKFEMGEDAKERRKKLGKKQKKVKKTDSQSIFFENKVLLKVISYLFKKQNEFVAS
jgi:hypothetical protein